MKIRFIIIFVLLFTISPMLLAQQQYLSKLAYRADINYINKLESNTEAKDLMGRLKSIDSKTTMEFEDIRDNGEELDKLQTDVRNFLEPRAAVYHNEAIEKHVSKYLLSRSDILYVEGVYLQNSDWELSKGGTYKYYEFDAVCKNALNTYVLVNGYYKKELTSNSRSRSGRNPGEPYVYIKYKRNITYKNDYHKLIRN